MKTVTVSGANVEDSEVCMLEFQMAAEVSHGRPPSEESFKITVFPPLTGPVCVLVFFFTVSP